MKGKGADEAAIMDILCTRSCQQRVEIVGEYKKLLGRDLVASLKSEIRGRFQELMVTLLYPMEEFLARELCAAIKGTPTDVDCLVEIMCTRSNKDIHDIKESYSKATGKDLESDIKSGTSAEFTKLLLSVCNHLQQAGVNTWSTGGSVFNQILASQSYEQLRLVFQEYKNLAGRSVVQAIESEVTGNHRAAYLAIAKYLANIPYYFAEKLDSAIKARGAESSDKALVRIIVSRCEVDLAEIKEEYAKHFGMPLQDAIRNATLKPHAAFDAQADAQTLRTAMKGKGSDKTAIMEVLCARSGYQRLAIVREYKQMFNRDLVANLKSELRGRFEDLMVTLLFPIEEFLARELRAAIKGVGTDEDVLVEILCTRSNKDIRDIKESYAKVFNQILTNQSYEQLRLVFQEYNNLTGRSVVQAIESEMTGNLRAAYLAIAKCVANIPYYFAEKLERAIKAQGVIACDKTIVRIIVSRCEVDLVHIKGEYAKNFKMQLQDAIRMHGEMLCHFL
ncbi:annexin A6-like [Haemaphysalis longicornis]